MSTRTLYNMTKLSSHCLTNFNQKYNIIVLTNPDENLKRKTEKPYMNNVF